MHNATKKPQRVLLRLYSQKEKKKTSPSPEKNRSREEVQSIQRGCRRHSMRPARAACGRIQAMRAVREVIQYQSIERIQRQSLEGIQRGMRLVSRSRGSSAWGPVHSPGGARDAGDNGDRCPWLAGGGRASRLRSQTETDGGCGGCLWTRVMERLRQQKDAWKGRGSDCQGIC